MGQKISKTLLLLSFLKMECILLFLGKKNIRLKRLQKSVFWGNVSSYLCVLTDWLQFLEIMWLPVQLKSAQGCPPPWLCQEIGQKTNIPLIPLVLLEGAVQFASAGAPTLDETRVFFSFFFFFFFSQFCGFQTLVKKFP